MHYLVTGAAGFIGSHLVDLLLSEGHTVMGLDKLTYAGCVENLDSARRNKKFVLAVNDVCDEGALDVLFSTWNFDGVFHLAAETHVDRSIVDASEFVRTNVLGTSAVLEASKRHWEKLVGERRDRFRLVVVSTDEVFGSLDLDDGRSFVEESLIAPRSPYAASKASADMLAMAHFRTHGLPVIVTRCGNNYGSRQFPEKLIPLAIERGIRWQKIPLYGDGKNVRDWIHVADHCAALLAVMERGKVGGSYVIGARNERSNESVLRMICDALDEVVGTELLVGPGHAAGSHHSLVTRVEDRKGHDRRYAIDPSRIERETGWKAHFDFDLEIFHLVKGRVLALRAGAER